MSTQYEHFLTVYLAACVWHPEKRDHARIFWWENLRSALLKRVWWNHKHCLSSAAVVTCQLPPRSWYVTRPRPVESVVFMDL